jgi:hypothetical protein
MPTNCPTPVGEGKQLHYGLQILHSEVRNFYWHTATSIAPVKLCLGMKPRLVVTHSLAFAARERIHTETNMKASTLYVSISSRRTCSSSGTWLVSYQYHTIQYVKPYKLRTIELRNESLAYSCNYNYNSI